MSKTRLTDDLLNIFQVAALIGRNCRPPTIGPTGADLPGPIEFGGRYRWRQSDLVEWAESGFPTREPAEKDTKARA